MHIKELRRRLEVKSMMVGIAVYRFGDEVGKSYTIGSPAFIRECIAKCKDELSKDGGLLDEISENPDKFTYDIHSDVRAGYWANLATWSSTEAAHLAIGRDPGSRSPLKETDMSTIKEFKQITKRFKSVNKRASARDIYEHLRNFDAEFPKELSEKFNSIFRNNPKNRYDRLYNNLHNEIIDDGKYKATIFSIIYALGNVPYKYTPDKNNEAASKISSMTEDVGMYVSVPTIRKQLKAVHDFHQNYLKRSKA
ncbi:hypothetical protein [Azorhizobium sp. AG788]|uniref:hypothetical protein n=1 Tax=Azorhizobium sp. AG788 TaxID=2183897 RepID=UPI0031398E6F